MYRFDAIALIVILPALAAAQERLTASQVIERIQKNVGVPWRSETVDTFKAGDPGTPVTGIATTMMATLEVLRRAAASGKNLIITHEPTFYEHSDKSEALVKAADPVLAQKKAFIQEHGLVVWRFHDHWHMRRPDGVNQGVIRWMGWEKFVNPGRGNSLSIPETTVADLAAAVKTKLNASAVRVVGDPRMKVTKVALVPGAAASTMQMAVLERDDVEVVIIGETREWETVEYVRDASAQGKKKALIIAGHVPSEQPGMEECARWLKTFVTEVPIEFIAASDPFSVAK